MPIYIIISLFLPCHCSICGPYLTVRTKISRANVHFAALTLFISKESKWSHHYSVSVNTEDLVVLPNFKLRLFENEADKKRNWITILPKKKIVVPTSWVCMKSYDVTISEFFSAVLSHFSVTCKTSVQQFAKLNFGSLNFDVGTDFFRGGLMPWLQYIPINGCPRKNNELLTNTLTVQLIRLSMLSSPSTTVL